MLVHWRETPEVMGMEDTDGQVWMAFCGASRSFFSFLIVQRKIMSSQKVGFWGG